MRRDGPEAADPGRARLGLQARLEEGLARMAVAGLAALSPVGASNLCGAVARLIGPRLPVSRVADRNLRAALPDLDAAERRQIIRGVWDNLGRVVGELPHVAGLRHNPGSGPGWDIVNAEVLDALARRGGPALFVSAHTGNWEVLPLGMAAHGMTLATVYRAAGNPGINRLIIELRQRVLGASTPTFAKGLQGARAMRAYLAAGGYVGMLIDQKMNDGIEAKLFGLRAMTASAAASFALKLRCPIIPARVTRLGPAKFRMIVEEPLVLAETGDRRADLLAITQAINDVLERWIRDRPAEWLWLHRRFPKDVV